MSPSRQGFDADRLEDAVRRIGEMKGVYSFILVRNGYMVVEKYFREGYRNKPHNLKSASKSVVSMLIGIAIQERYLALDQPVAELLPRIKSFQDPMKRRMTVRHLLTMTSGLDPTSYDAYNLWTSNRNWVAAALDRSMLFEPGTRFQYSTGDSHVLSGILTAATGMSTLEFAKQKLFGPLDIAVQGWATDPSGIYQGGNNLSLTPRDMAKLGQLYLDGGRFGNRQVVPEWWVHASTRVTDLDHHEVYGTYGYSWYVNPGGKDAFVAVGFGGQYIYVSPRQDCVVVVTSTLRSKGRAWEKMLFSLLQNNVLGSIEAVREGRVYAAAGGGDKGARDVPGAGILPENASDANSAARNGTEAAVNSGAGTRTSVSLQVGQANTSIVLRSEPDRGSSKIGIVEPGEQLVIVETRGKWFRVHSRNREGWVHGDYVQRRPGAAPPAGGNGKREKDGAAIAAQRIAESGTSPTERSAAGEAKTTSARTKTRLNLRAGPGTSYVVIKALAPATDILVKGRTGAWLRVQAGPAEGWVHGDYIAAVPPVESEQIVMKAGAPDTEPVAAGSGTEETPAPGTAGATRTAANLKELRDRVDQIGNRIDAAEQEKQQVDGALGSIRRALERQAEAAVRSETAEKRLESELAAAQESIAMLRQAVQSGQAGREAQGKDLASARQEIGDLRKSLTGSRDDRERLNRELAVSREAIDRLHKDLETLGADREKLKTDVASLRQNLEDQRNAGSAARTSRELLETALGSDRREIQALKTTVEKLLADQKKLNAELSFAGEEMGGLKKEFQASRAAGERLGTEVARLESEVRIRKTAAEKAEANSVAMRTELTTAQQEIENLKTAVAAASADRERVNTALATARETIATLNQVIQAGESGHDTLSKELASARQEIDVLHKKLAESRDDRKRLDRELAAFREANDRLHKDLEALGADRDRLDTEVAALRLRLEDQRNAAAKAHTSRELLKTDLGVAHREIGTLKAEMEKQAADLEALGAALISSRASIGGLQKETQASSAARDTLAAEVRRLGSEVQSWKTAVENAKAAGVATRAELTTARQEIETLKSANQASLKDREQLVSTLFEARKEMGGLREELQKSLATREQLDARLSAARRELEGQAEPETSTGKTSLEAKKTKPVLKTAAAQHPGSPPGQRPQRTPTGTFVESWAAAWSRRDVAGYLSHYSPEFEPGSGKSRDAWRRQRKARLEGPAFIEIRVEGIEKEVTGEGRVRMTFQQQYRSDTYVDRVIKILDLAWEDNGWKIIRETSRPIK